MPLHKTSRLTKYPASFLSLLLTALAIHPAVLSLESDKNQDIIYSSLGGSTSRIENGIRIVTFEQDVKVAQGTLEISGDSARLESEVETGAVRRLSVTGSPARYRQQLDTEGNLVEGESESIFYSVEGEPVVEFIGSAVLKGANDILRCAAIKYYTDSQYTETTGPCQGVSGQVTTSPSLPVPPAAN